MRSLALFILLLSATTNSGPLSGVSPTQSCSKIVEGELAHTHDKYQNLKTDESVLHFFERRFRGYESKSYIDCSKERKDSYRFTVFVNSLNEARSVFLSMIDEVEAEYGASKKSSLNEKERETEFHFLDDDVTSQIVVWEVASGRLLYLHLEEYSDRWAVHWAW